MQVVGAFPSGPFYDEKLKSGETLQIVKKKDRKPLLKMQFGKKKPLSQVCMVYLKTFDPEPFKAFPLALDFMRKLADEVIEGSTLVADLMTRRDVLLEQLLA